MFSTIGILALASSVVALLTTFSDINSSSHKIAIEYLHKHGIVNGYPDGTFRPDNPMNRAEILKMLVHAKHVTPSETMHNCFPDVHHEWFAPYVCYAKQQQWVSGYTDGLFYPDKVVTTAEALKMIINAMTYTSSATTQSRLPYTDVDLNAWYAPFVQSAFHGNLLDWIKGTVLGIDSPMTRGEVSEILYRILYVPDEISSAHSGTSTASRGKRLIMRPKYRGGGGNGSNKVIVASSSSVSSESSSSTASSSSASIVCGDSIAQGDESCDDGNATSGDGCSNSCAVEAGFSCSGAPSTCSATCGDGIRAGDESCDDGNATSGDGCSNSCAVEAGFSCSGAPSTCSATCGDGIRAGDESCDDGNATSGDGCSNSCAVEAGFSCSGAPSTCSATCGDGIRAGDESCDDGNATSGDGCSNSCEVE